MLKRDETAGFVVIIGVAVFGCLLTVGSWLLNVYIIVKTAKWMGWL